MRRLVFPLIYSAFLLLGCSSDSVAPNASEPSPPTVTPQSPTAVTLEAEAEDEFFVFVPKPFFFDESELFYARLETLDFDDDGFLVNSRDLIPILFVTNPDGSAVSTSLAVSERLLLNVQEGFPRPTTNVEVGVDLAQISTVFNNEIDDEAFNQCQPSPLLFNAATSVTVFDSFGQQRVMTMFFIKTDQENSTWAVRVTADCQLLEPVFNQSALDFNIAGELDIGDADNDGEFTSDNGRIGYRSVNFEDGSELVNLTIDFANGDGEGTRSVSDNFNVFSLQQDGFLADNFESLTINREGIVTVTLSDIGEQVLGKLALARFDNPENLISVGDGLFQETATSGNAEYGEALVGGFEGVVEEQVDL